MGPMTTGTDVVTTAEPEVTGRRGRPRLSEGARAERRLGWLLCAPAVIVMLAVAAFPILYAVWLSLQRYDLRFPQLATFVGLSNYGAVLSSPFWWHALIVTLIITVVSLAVEFVLGMLLALLMYRTIFTRGTVRTIILIPYGIVTVAAAYGWQYAWTPHIGYLVGPESAPLTSQGSAIAIIILAEIWKTTPFMALLLMKPAILVALLFRALDAFRIFDNIYILTGGGNGTYSVSILGYDNLFRALNLGIGSAISILIFICVAIIAFIFIRLFGAAAPGM
jgi:multiple sugar transport system permease protein